MIEVAFDTGSLLVITILTARMLASLVMLRSILFRQAGRMRGGVRGLVQINAANTTSTASIIRFLNPARSIHGIVCSSMSASFIALHFYSANSQSSRSPIEIAKEAEKMYGTNPKVGTSSFIATFFLKKSMPTTN